MRVSEPYKGNTGREVKLKMLVVYMSLFTSIIFGAYNIINSIEFQRDTRELQIKESQIYSFAKGLEFVIGGVFFLALLTQCV